ncbi:MAG: ferrous iron transport protein B [Caldisericia bacterium]|nr:ferrous iron transport protein B [Caldisericia bacterium]
MTKISLLGQPNSGKTSLFNLLTGASQEVGNWPGVTVEIKEGKCRIHKEVFTIIDLPGVYSLSPFTMEEKVTRDYLLAHQDVRIINVLDANHMERQLFLTFQLLLLGKPTIVALNMMDELEQKGISIDSEKLSTLFHIPVVQIVAREGRGLTYLTEMFSLDPTKSKPVNPFYDSEFESVHSLFFIIRNLIGNNENDPTLDFQTFQILLAPELLAQKQFNLASSEISGIQESINQWELSHNQTIADFLYSTIYAWAKSIESQIVKTNIEKNKTFSLDQKMSWLENWILHPWIGLVIFGVVMFLLFHAIFFSGDFIKDYLESFLSVVIQWANGIPSPLWQSFFSRAILQGVGNIVLLLPYIFCSFLFLSWLEDLGYLSRAAYVMDRFMHKLGLHGKSFIPLILGFGCNVPAVMACRTMETEEEKIKTMMMVSFIPCSGRLPVLLSLCGLLFSRAAGIWMFVLYTIGILASVLTGFFLEKTFIHTPSGELIMELPPYRWPYLKNNLKNAIQKTKQFLVKAGTIIFLVSVFIWFLSYFPNPSDFGGSTSALGTLGKWVAPVFSPLGFDWRLTVSLISGFVAKELILSTISILFNQSAGSLTGLLSLFSRGTLLAFLIFQLLYTPCLATVTSIKNESYSLKWTIFSILWSSSVAWIFAWVIHFLA